jgi:hypothetical protein
VSGGAYEYGYRYLSPTLGFIAGWMFLCAKTASAATAALGFGGYALAAFGVDGGRARIAVGAAVVAVLTLIGAGGMTRSSRVNAIIVSITLAALAVFILTGIPTARVAPRSTCAGSRPRPRPQPAPRHRADVRRVRGLRAHRDARRGGPGPAADDPIAVGTTLRRRLGPPPAQIRACTGRSASPKMRSCSSL